MSVHLFACNAHIRNPSHSTDEPALRGAVNTALTTFSRIDALILNAGVVAPFGFIADPSATSIAAWRKHFDVNFFSLVPALQASAPALRASKRGGRVVFVSSGSATSGTPTWGVYNASKAAMNSLCRYVAVNVGEVWRAD